MKAQIRCLLSAILVVFFSIGIVFIGVNSQEKTKTINNPIKDAVQSEVVVRDFIHDNYVISEKNPWTDYSLKPIEYKTNGQEINKTVGAKSAILVDVKNKNILYQKNADERRAPASTTKLMTALTVLQTMNLNDVITIGDEANMIASDSSKAGFSKGQIVTVEELLNGMLIASGNDAAYILANATGKAIFQDNIANEGKNFSNAQCVERFVLEMNKNVRDMKLENTHFTTPDGYDETGQYTSAGDLSKIAMEAYNNKTIADICKKSGYTSETLGKTWTSTNQLLLKNGSYYYQYCQGMKTGTTDIAGKCLVSVAKKGDRECLSVVLGENTDEGRFGDAKSLLESGVQ